MTCFAALAADPGWTETTRKLYLRNILRFLEWSQEQQVRSLDAIQPSHVAAYLKELRDRFSLSTVTQHLAAIRQFFDRLAGAAVLPTNPVRAAAHARPEGRRAKHGASAGGDVGERLLDGIDATTLVGLRDRALLGLVTRTGVPAAWIAGLRVRDVLRSDGQCRLRVPAGPGASRYIILDGRTRLMVECYIDAAGGVGEGDHPLFPATGGAGRASTPRAVGTRDVQRILRRGAASARLRGPAILDVLRVQASPAPDATSGPPRPSGADAAHAPAVQGQHPLAGRIASLDASIAAGRRRLAEQARLLDRLRSLGESTALAERLLETWEETLSAWLASRQYLADRVALLQRA